MDAETLSLAEAERRLSEADGILIPGGFGIRGIEGKIAAVRFARENGVPYLGICLGMQVAVVEFARHVAGLEGANSSEFDPESPHPVIDLLPEQKEVEDMGGTMRLGADPVTLVDGSKAFAAYGERVVQERHRHRYEVNNRYRYSSSPRGCWSPGRTRRAAGRGDRAARPSLVRGQPVPPRVQVAAEPAPAAVPRLRRRCGRAPLRRRGRRGARGGARHAVGFGRPLATLPADISDEPTWTDLLARMREFADLSRVGSLLGWDQETMMPMRGADARARQLATMRVVRHERLCDPALGELLDAHADDPDPARAAMVRNLAHERDRAAPLPVEFVRRLALAESTRLDHVAGARAADDFAAFLPALEEVIAVKREQAELIGYEGEPYDALLDGHEPGVTAARLEPLLGSLRDGLRELLAEIVAADPLPEAPFAGRPFPRDAQWSFTMDVLADLGFDLRVGPPGRLGAPVQHDDRAERRPPDHADRRLDPFSGLFATIHECGHGLYEQGFDRAFETRRWTTRRRTASTSRSRGCGRTWSAAAARSGSTTRRSSRRLPRRCAGRTWTTSPARQPGGALAGAGRGRRGHLQPPHRRSLRPRAGGDAA